MILSIIYNIDLAANMLSGAYKLSVSLGKRFTVTVFQNNDVELNNEKFENILSELNIKPEKLLILENESKTVSELCEENEVLFLFIQLENYSRKSIQKQLNACRDLRIPYLLYRNDFKELNLEQVIVPISFLEEEIEKAQFASAFGRFCNSKVLLLPAADYGSKAATTTTKMTDLFSKFEFEWEIIKATKDSFKIDEDAMRIAEKQEAGLVLVSASRDYGLDDVIFGPKELHLIKKSVIPVLLVNPRGDLYTLCD